jgi:drug/metabolite transporter (DMT)-like permease
MGVGSLDIRGAWLVLGSATVWSFGGAIARFLTVSDSWTIVFWRSVFAASFLLCFMLWQNGRKATLALFLAMGWPGVGVAACFAMASTCFVVALAYTTVANVLLLQAGVPLIAALMAFVFFRERIPRATWIAIATVISGVAVMVSESFGGNVSPIGDGLALMVALAFATATVVTRRHAHVAMMPAVCLGTVIAACVSAALVGGFAVGAADGALLFAFGALNLGLGLALFVTGVRRLPAAVAALIGIAEPVLGPLWVWLIHHEIPSQRTILGGAVVFVALVAHILWQLRQPSQETPTATS